MIYLENAATTEKRPEVVQIERILGDVYGNAQALYSLGKDAREVIELARNEIATEIGAKSGEVFFTSGATEGNNWAVKGAVWGATSSGPSGHLPQGGLRGPHPALTRHLPQGGRLSEGFVPVRPPCPHVVTTEIEHHSVLNTVKALEETGLCGAAYISPDPVSGEVSEDDVIKEIRDTTVLVSVMMVNNETGALNPVEKIGRRIAEHNERMHTVGTGRHVLFHVDATQAIGKIKVDVNEIGCDMLTASGHKFHAGKGRGFMYLREGTKIANLMEGGAQQMGLRPGTEDTVGAACLAMGLAMERVSARQQTIHNLTDELMVGLKGIEDMRINGTPCYPCGIVSVGFKGVESEALLQMLEMRGVVCSAGSACATGSVEESHVLTAMRVPEEYLRGTIRVSVGAMNTVEEIREAAAIIRECVGKLREM